jgi:hypothetical protein
LGRIRIGFNEGFCEEDDETPSSIITREFLEQANKYML